MKLDLNHLLEQEINDGFYMSNLRYFSNRPGSTNFRPFPLSPNLAGKFEASLKVAPEEVSAALSDPDKSAVAKLNGEIATLNGQKRSFGRIQALVDVGPPLPAYLLRRGNYETPGPDVGPGFLEVLCDPAPSGEQARLHVDSPNGAATSGRRLALARWLTDPGSRAAGLAARVMVNRIWEHHFGQGLVATPDNFGRSGSPPTHPELLEWLAADFVDHGWRVKRLHKLIMTSSVYRQASSEAKGEAVVRRRLAADSSDGASSDPLLPTANSVLPWSVDPDNTLLWRQRLRRLESEAIRDSILAASGKLDRTLGGPPVPLENRSDGMVVVAEKGLPTATSQYRRSLYLLARRNYQPTMLAVFDQPVLANNCTQRTTSAVSLQSLTMLNDAFVLEQAERFAERVAASAGPAPDKRIELAFRIALARKPTPAEMAPSLALIQQHTERYQKQPSPQLTAAQAADKALAHLCHMLLNTNEFLYVE